MGPPTAWGSTARGNSSPRPQLPAHHRVSPQPGQHSQRGCSGHPRAGGTPGVPAPVDTPEPFHPGGAVVMPRPLGGEHSPSCCTMDSRFLFPAGEEARTSRVLGTTSLEDPSSESSRGDIPAGTHMSPGCKTLSPGWLLSRSHPQPQNGVCGGRASARPTQPGAAQAVQGPSAKLPTQGVMGACTWTPCDRPGAHFGEDWHPPRGVCVCRAAVRSPRKVIHFRWHQPCPWPQYPPITVVTPRQSQQHL